MSKETGAVPRPIVEIVGDLVSPHDCEFDHHGGCQMHGYLELEPGEICPQAEAKRWLTEQVKPH